MRRAAAYLACLALVATGCLHQVAPLTDLADGGGNGSTGGDAGDGGDAGLGGGGVGDVDGGDAGSACAWRDAGEAGLCSDDSQCPNGFYCDFTVTACQNDGFSTVNSGRCLLACSVTAVF